MFGFFNIDGPFYKTLTKITNYMILGVLWFISCIPVFTIGAACTALYATHHKVVINGNGYVWQTYWEQFRSNFKQSFILGLFMLIIFAALCADIYIVFMMSANNQMNLLVTAFAVIAVLGVMWMQYWFPYIAHIEDPVSTVLKNTLIITFAHLPRSLLILIVFALCVALNIFIPINPICFIAAPVIYCLFTYKSFYRVFSNYWDMTDGNAAFAEQEAAKED